MCSESYKIAFGAHHGYMIQGAAYIAIKTVPNREWLQEELKITNPQEVIGQLRTDFKAIRDNLFAYLKDNKLDQLP
jgi:hypothetical protein